MSVSQLEHVIAYAATASMLAAAYPALGQRVLIVGGLTFYAGILEIIQIWVPGRTSKFVDLVAGSFGALAGVLLVVALQSLLSRRLSAPTPRKLRKINPLICHRSFAAEWDCRRRSK
jgi:VanZ family protein